MATYVPTSLVAPVERTKVKMPSSPFKGRPPAMPIRTAIRGRARRAGNFLLIIRAAITMNITTTIIPVIMISPRFLSRSVFAYACWTAPPPHVKFLPFLHFVFIIQLIIRISIIIIVTLPIFVNAIFYNSGILYNWSHHWARLGTNFWKSFLHIFKIRVYLIYKINL